MQGPTWTSEHEEELAVMKDREIQWEEEQSKEAVRWEEIEEKRLSEKKVEDRRVRKMENELARLQDVMAGHLAEAAGASESTM